MFLNTKKIENLHVLQNNVKVLIFLERKLMSFHLITAQKA
jgi:hypothetical protein